ncbi:hypothetical protein D1151_00895 [Emergencia sp. 1XD21-10]|nr:hypothetical protein [Emergencia sp. 1XD21-10]
MNKSGSNVAFIFRIGGLEKMNDAIRWQEAAPQLIAIEERAGQAQAAVTGISAMEAAEIIKKTAIGSGLSILVFNSARGVEIVVRGRDAYEYLLRFLRELSVSECVK